MVRYLRHPGRRNEGYGIWHTATYDYGYFFRGPEYKFFQGALQIALVGEFEFMDLLYSRYASPVQFMETYIEQGRFGEFVTNILEMEMERTKETAQKDEDYKLWLAYIHSMTDQSFHDWKKGLMEKKEPVSYAMTDKQVDIVKQQARGILNKFSPV